MAAVSTLSTKGTARLGNTAYDGRVLITGGRLRVLARNSVELFAADVDAIDRTSRSTWTVTLAGGDVLYVESAGCGCSKSR